MVLEFVGGAFLLQGDANSEREEARGYFTGILSSYMSN